MNRQTATHKQAFESVYQGRWNAATDLALHFPLEEIERYPWRRGPSTDRYYNYLYRRFTSHCLSRLALAPGQRVLVVGCGFGFDEKNIKTLFPTVDLWSVDISAEMLKLATTSGSPGHFALALAESLPFPDNSFDRVISREVIEHVMAPQAMLNEIRRVLAPGGIALVTTENGESWSPANRFDHNANSLFSRLFNRDCARTYQDEAPPLDAMKRFVREADLVLEDYFWDGALYQYLPRTGAVLGPRLPRVAHYFSCLENNRSVAFRFCDQAKYVLRKPAIPGAALSARVSYACPRCRERLEASGEHLKCTGCAIEYPTHDQIPHLIPLEDDQPAGTADSARTPRPQKSPLALRLAKRLVRDTYATTYVIGALLCSLFVTKNRRVPSHLIPDGDRFQSFIRVR